MLVPHLPEIGILALVPDTWGRIWQARHHVLTRLAQYFHIVWINPAHEWREIFSRCRQRFSENTDEIRIPGFTIYAPELWLPQLYRPQWLARFTLEQRLTRARRLLSNRGCQKIVVYLWRPQFEFELKSGSYDLSCFHIDDEYSFSPVEAPLDPIEARLIASVDQVFIHSRSLLAKKGSINPHTAFIPNGVDYYAYSVNKPEPKDLTVIPYPRIGYTGILKNQLDWPLLRHLTEDHPEWSFVLVGPLQGHPEIHKHVTELAKRRNVYFLGPKPVQELASYPQHFSVCIMPYLANDYTKYINPLKLYEYMASGRPVVGTRINSLEEFAGLVSLASSPPEWSIAIQDALSPLANTPERRTARQTAARQHDWQALVLQIAKTIARRFGQEVSDGLTESRRSCQGLPLSVHP